MPLQVTSLDQEGEQSMIVITVVCDHLINIMACVHSKMRVKPKLWEGRFLQKNVKLVKACARGL